MVARTFDDVQAAVLERYGVNARQSFIDVAAIDGRAHVLSAGEGPPLVMLNGAGTPAARA